MANSNINLSNKLFAYIQHGVDITDSIKTNYASSLIFIGDEGQIYNPGTNTYIGIGQTSYTNTIAYAQYLGRRLDAMNTTLSSTLVSKIYGQYDGYDVTALTGTPGNNNGFYVTGQVTIKGIGDYDAAHERSYVGIQQTGWGVDGNGDKSTFIWTPTESANKYGSSGITVSIDRSMSGQTEGGLGGSITYYNKNVITIDDSLTWSYITSRTSYTLAFAQQYADDTANRVYHNLIGDSQATYIPVTLASVTEAVEDTVPERDENDIANVYSANTYRTNKVVYWRQQCGEHADPAPDGKVVVPGSGGVNDTIWYRWVEVPVGTTVTNTNGVFSLAGIQDNFEYDEDHALVVYVVDDQYSSTYNMNIADGIQTLKEVAYLLDVLTDGIGSTYTYYEYDENGVASGPYTGITSDEGSAETLGIRMAYTLADNRIQINYLDNRMDAIEHGTNTLRSLQGTGSSFVKVTTEASKTDGKVLYENGIGGALNLIDLNSNYQSALDRAYQSQGASSALPAYMLGDVNLKVNLDLAQTYIVTNVDGAQYQPADMSNIVIDTTAQGSAGSAYYVLENSTFTQLTNAEVITDQYANDGKNYYWLNPDSEYDADANKKYIDTNINVSGIQNQTEFYNALTGAGYTISSGSETVYYKDLGDDTITSASAAALWESINSGTVSRDVTIYYLQDLGTLKHANTTIDGLTTVEWVTTYVGDVVTEINADATGVLEEAKTFTRNVVNALQGEGHGKASEYAYSYTQANGYVGLYYRELPATYVNNAVDVWGTETSNVYNKQYVTIETVNEDTKSGNDYITKEILDVLATDNTIARDEIFVILAADQFDYKPVNVVGTVPQNTYYVKTSNGFAVTDGANGDINRMHQLYPYEQLYERVTKYTEVNAEDIISTVTYDSNGDVATSVVTGFFINGAVVSISDILEENGARHIYVASTPPQNVNNSEYLTTEAYHYSSEENGHGENRIKVTAHITYLEDATKSNTGFADAYDVRSFIENIITWVDLSACITTDDVNKLEYQRALTGAEVSALSSVDGLKYFNDQNNLIAADNLRNAQDAANDPTSPTTYYMLNEKFVVNNGSISGDDAGQNVNIGHTNYNADNRIYIKTIQL